MIDFIAALMTGAHVRSGGPAVGPAAGLAAGSSGGPAASPKTITAQASADSAPRPCTQAGPPRRLPTRA